MITSDTKKAEKLVSYYSDRVRRAVPEDIPAVLSLEKQLSEDRPGASAQGFLLSGGGDTPEKYAEFVKDGPFYVVEDAGHLVGFVFALNPAGSRMLGLKKSRDKFTLKDPNIFDAPNLSWLAKVGVVPELMGRGVAAALYSALLADHANYNFITTTVREPLRNVPSEKLQEKFGFEAVGTLPLGDRGAFKNVLCTVYYRQASVLRDF